MLGKVIVALTTPGLVGLMVAVWLIPSSVNCTCPSVTGSCPKASTLAVRVMASPGAGVSRRHVVDGGCGALRLKGAVVGFDRRVELGRLTPR